MTGVYLGLGSNLQPEKNVPLALNALKEHFNVQQISPWYQSAAQGFDGPDFINLVVAIEYANSLEQLAQEVRKLEFACGRPDNAQKNTSRSIDIDILLFGDFVGEFISEFVSECSKGIIPRPDIEQFAFVLRPLLDIAPKLIHPKLQVPLYSLWPAVSAQPLQLVSAE